MRKDEFGYNILREYHDPGKEYFDQGDEVVSCSEEIQTSAPEYVSSADEFNDESDLTFEEMKLQKSAHRKLIRKMSYLVAATVSTVVIGQAAGQNDRIDTERSPLVQEESESTGQSDFEWIKVPGLDGIIEDEPTEAITESILSNRLISLADYESFGWANGGVIPVKKDALWGLLDYDGNVILEPQYTVFVSSPNDTGTTVLGNEGSYDVIDRRGQAVLSFSDYTYSVSVGEQDVVLVQQSVEDGFEALGLPVVDEGYGAIPYLRFQYLHLNGDVIYDTGWFLGEQYFSRAQDFHEGRAYVYNGGDGSQYAVLYEVTLENGAREIDRETVTETRGGWDFDITVAPIGALADGWYLGECPGGGGGWYLFQPSTQAMTPRTLGIADAGSEEGYVASVEMCAYKDNGCYIYNYGTIGVCSVLDDYGGTKIKDLLFDYTKAYESAGEFGEEFMTDFIASYDSITINNFPYLVAQQGDDYFYIDLNGNVVSDVYETASSFNDHGYAIVQEGDKAYIINSMFEKVDMIEGIQAIGYNDDTFVVEYPDETVAVYCFE